MLKFVKFEHIYLSYLKYTNGSSPHLVVVVHPFHRLSRRPGLTHVRHLSSASRNEEPRLRSSCHRRLDTTRPAFSLDGQKSSGKARKPSVQLGGGGARVRDTTGGSGGGARAGSNPEG